MEAAEFKFLAALTQAILTKEVIHTLRAANARELHGFPWSQSHIALPKLFLGVPRPADLWIVISATHTGTASVTCSDLRPPLNK